ncbi:response regulator transcription factor [Nocardia asteroides]|uniref:response regulator transcription factor n=1 Tax=Nocardia asteroides TaxID=1824 RepID=UPI001E57EDCF|nr:response regulator transcription factor [Nocardia asteroides]UGT60373.1 response regulator transcription factor [Nocardia asteroides]
MQVLIVEDDHDLAEELHRGLESQGFQGFVANTGRDALILHTEAEVVLLDIGLPDMDGLEVCRKIRTISNIPIIILSGRSDEIDRVLGLKLGADDYVIKPHSLRELAARLEAVIRRARQSGENSSPAGIARIEGDVRVLREIRIDVGSRKVTVKNREVSLTRREFAFLELLAREPGKVFSREDIMIEAWGHDGAGDTRTLGVHVASLRKKLGVPAIETVRGVGFRLAS